MIYLIGSLRNPNVQRVARRLRVEGYHVFDDWQYVGPEADGYWRRAEKARGRTYQQALNGAAATNNFAFDKRHIDAADIGIMVMPCGKSGHLELGYMCPKPTFILFDREPKRWDLMYKFATGICFSIGELLTCLKSLTPSESAGSLMDPSPVKPKRRNT